MAAGARRHPRRSRCAAAAAARARPADRRVALPRGADRSWSRSTSRSRSSSARSRRCCCSSTLFRLALNVASTRLISARRRGADAAGDVIQAFGEFVVGGNFVVGVVVFLILVIINFIVITKGAGRITEVAARFTLDSMPGKQMAIDADLERRPHQRGRGARPPQGDRSARPTSTARWTAQQVRPRRRDRRPHHRRDQHRRRHHRRRRPAGHARSADAAQDLHHALRRRRPRRADPRAARLDRRRAAHHARRRGQTSARALGRPAPSRARSRSLVAGGRAGRPRAHAGHAAPARSSRSAAALALASRRAPRRPRAAAARPPLAGAAPARRRGAADRRSAEGRARASCCPSSCSRSRSASSCCRSSTPARGGELLDAHRLAAQAARARARLHRPAGPRARRPAPAPRRLPRAASPASTIAAGRGPRRHACSRSTRPAAPPPTSPARPSREPTFGLPAKWIAAERPRPRRGRRLHRRRPVGGDRHAPHRADPPPRARAARPPRGAGAARRRRASSNAKVVEELIPHLMSLGDVMQGPAQPAPRGRLHPRPPHASSRRSPTTRQR